MSGDEVSEKHCPLCMENLELDDQNFYPCKCGYQVCSFCWHRLRTDGNGLCPACRQAYPEVPASFKSIKAGKQQKDSNKQRKAPSKSEQTIRELSAYRVLQMNLIYVTGLSPRIADVDTLKKNEFFGQFGKILKLSISNGNGGSANLSSACAYVTYAKGEEALRAIQTFHNTVIDGRNIKVSLGTTKYCASFLRNLPCPKVGCSYCHELADMEISFTAEDMQQGKHSEYEKRLLEQFERKTAASTAQPAQAPSVTVERKIGASTIEWFDQRTAPPQNDRVSSLRKAAEEPHPLSESVRRLSMLAEQHSAQERESRCSRVVNDSRNESQAGLRALLPNVNVRFVEQRESQSLGQFHKVVCDRQAGTPLADAPLSTSPRFEASISRFFQSFENSSNRAIPIPPGFTHLFQR
ncbi:hypothetical protein QR680_016859 [Steinernema hermaphroditum]|uniref:RING-type domain-containing protein n=1 Tax=Steinernema hermaphroditum TaxID=289476 RepID=A0AA39LN85_9BILA|nr:hypothetical protein QR680_016859 [Steinernema hermaphroditum]